MSKNIINKLDLQEYIESLKSLFAREKSISLEGDINIHFKLINEISTYTFKMPPKVNNLDNQIMHLKKKGDLKLYEIYEFVKIINYFKYIQRFTLESKLEEWINKIIVPIQIDKICEYFNDKGDIKQGINEDFDMINDALYNNKRSIKDALYQVMGNKKLQAYLIDHQVHFIHGQQTILVRAGFNASLKAKVLDRSNAGFFYVVPHSVEKLKQRQEELQNQKEELLLKIAKEYSDIFNNHIMFLSFINKEFDRFDHYISRVEFSKIDDKNFILPNKSKKIEKLVDFIHPALHNAKPVSIDFSKSVIMITGVNAGGKTMLLKSLLSATYLSKYLIPYRAHKDTKVGHYKDIIAVLDDPQSVKNDISTFAGRMVEFSKLFNKTNAIVGVDEIELGTDSDEAASLFKVIIEKLMKKDIKIVITTHHKRLASLMAAHDEVELIAAIFDEKNRRPTYEFLQGTIGQSFAFETALRYGIPLDVINKAKEVYGDDKDKLNDLIARSSTLEMEYRKKIEALDNNIKESNRLKQNLQEQKESIDKKLSEYKNSLHTDYKSATGEAKKAIKTKIMQQAHRHLNEAHKKLQGVKEVQVEEEIVNFKVGDRVKYNSTKGSIISIKGSKVYFESDDGMKIQVKMKSLRRSGNPVKVKAVPKVRVSVAKPKGGHVKLDLHGQRADEAIENLDIFLSDCLINGFDEVLVYHGIGTGKLAYAVKEFLDRYPKLRSYTDAPPIQGGFGAKIIKL
ncbi:MAG TPA: endonuclease MutS2 [Arcobacter sp.]|nr:endonuclease MutS2 [Arcobacter sp.]